MPSQGHLGGGVYVDVSEIGFPLPAKSGSAGGHFGVSTHVSSQRNVDDSWPVRDSKHVIQLLPVLLLYGLLKQGVVDMLVCR